MTYIIWDPNGTIIDLGFYALRWYSVLFAMGFVFSYIILKKQFAKEDVPEEKLERLTIYVVLATVIGARLGHCLFYDQSGFEAGIIIDMGQVLSIPFIVFGLILIVLKRDQTTASIEQVPRV